MNKLCLFIVLAIFQLFGIISFAVAQDEFNLNLKERDGGYILKIQIKNNSDHTINVSKGAGLPNKIKCETKFILDAVYPDNVNFETLGYRVDDGMKVSFEKLRPQRSKKIKFFVDEHLDSDRYLLFRIFDVDEGKLFVVRVNSKGASLVNVSRIQWSTQVPTVVLSLFSSR